VPPDLPGAGAAANTAVRQIGTALGVAILGALLSMRYRTLVTPHLSALPLAARHGAAESIEKTFAAAGGAGPTAAGQIADGARQAFVGATHTTVLVAAALTAVGALIVAVLLPARAPERPPMPQPIVPRLDSVAAHRT
jgi:MFS transporter, DHA2 family, multidrug resistance protein